MTHIVARDLIYYKILSPTKFRAQLLSSLKKEEKKTILKKILGSS
jgi:hypothetical protein